MGTLGRLQNSLVAANQETTVQLASANFDFSLLKIEAPAEYKPFGQALSRSRQLAAEAGPSHMTARRLGSLFESFIPLTPSLLRAYGKRASDISKSPTINPKGSNDHGPFRDFVGMDGTNIWAAATSSNGALSIHLLACMLARAWPPGEATSIWVELVEQRKKELVSLDEGGYVTMSNLAAAQVSITKDHLAEWDAGARAWLEAADNSPLMKVKQKQLSLILDNLGLPVSNRPVVYDSVMEVWKTCLTTMDKIVQGVPHSIQSGAVLVALSSWHLYPDLVVLGAQNIEVKQSDDLVEPGGIVTIGLMKLKDESSAEVSWSLSLANLRYYGSPVPSKTTIGSNTSRISIHDMHFVVLGCLLGTWGVAPPRIRLACTILQKLGGIFHTFVQEHGVRPLSEIVDERSWLALISRTASELLGQKSEEFKASIKLVNIGMRRRGFLARSQGPFLGLTVSTMAAILTPKHAVKFLREIVAKVPAAKRESLVIRSKASVRTVYRSTNYRVYEGSFDYQTALPLPEKNEEGKVVSGAPRRFLRWCDRNAEVYADDNEELVACNLQGLTYIDHRVDESFEWFEPPAFFTKKAKGPNAWSLADKGFLKTEMPPPGYGRKKNKSFKETEKPPKPILTFDFLAGDSFGTAIYQRRQGSPCKVSDDGFTVEFLDRIFSLDGAIDPQMLIKVLSSSIDPEILRPLKAFSAISFVCDSFPDASVSPRLLSSDVELGKAHWIPPDSIYTQLEHPDANLRDDQHDHYLMLKPYTLTRARIFACIAMLETGVLNLEAHLLENVMALSVGNSLYVAAELLGYPSHSSCKIRKVMGNIGRAGLAFMIPPRDPKIRPHNPDNWRVVNHEEFDGQCINALDGTSLHLGFSGYEQPLFAGEHGNQYIDAFFIETMVSLHDRGEWIADMDILAAHESSLIPRMTADSSCPMAADFTKPDFYLTAMDNWDEVLDPPLHEAVIRAYGNWQARLAAMVLSIQQGRRPILCEDNMCWHCAQKHVQPRLLRPDQVEGYQISNFIL